MLHLDVRMCFHFTTILVLGHPKRFTFGPPSPSWYHGLPQDCTAQNKLSMIWQHQLLQFPNTGPQTVAAIANEYPSPCDLIKVRTPVTICLAHLSCLGLSSLWQWRHCSFVTTGYYSKMIIGWFCEITSHCHRWSGLLVEDSDQYCPKRFIVL